MSTGAPVRAAPTVAHPNRDGWVWTALPAGCRRVAVHGGTLAESLGAAGFEVVDTASADVDAMVIDAGRGQAAVRGAAALAGESRAGVVLLCFGRNFGTVRDRVPRWRRALEVAASTAASVRSAAAALGARRALSKQGWHVTAQPTGDRADSYAVGRGWWRRPPAGAIVTARRPDASGSTVLDECLAEAGKAIGQRLIVRSTTVAESGKVLARVEGERGGSFVLRLGGGSAGVLIDAAASAAIALTREEVPAAVRTRIAAPVARGGRGLVRYALEPWVSGAPPQRPIPARVWEDCLEFLSALHASPIGPDPAGRQDERTIEDRLQWVSAHATPEGRAVLDRIGPELTERLKAVPRGWGHGDFWRANVLARDGRLAWILDWDTARVDDLATSDLFDLLDSPAPAGGSTLGARLLSAVLPAVSGATDERVLRFCELTGTPHDSETLTAAAIAWWIDRVGRDLEECPDRQSRRQWLEDNVHDPLARLARP